MSVSLLAFVCAFLCVSHGYRPVIMMHGLATNNRVGNHRDWDAIRSWIAAHHPGTPTFALDVYEGVSSLHPLEEQLPVVAARVEEIRKNNSEAFNQGWIGMGHSQGGLIMRSLAQLLGKGQNMDRLITLAGVVGGYYGAPFAIPVIGKQLPLDVVTDIFYTDLAQKTASVPGFWKDPFDYQRYTEHVRYLPWINNEVSPRNESFRANFLSLRDVHSFGSPDDGDVVPWNTEIWGFYKDGTDSTLVPMNETLIYINDTFGLRTMDQRGRLFLHTIAGVQHAHWLSNETNFVTNVLPLLD